MRGKWLPLLLAVSVTFNVLFAIGYVRSRSTVPQRPSFEARMKLLVKPLDMDDQQAQRFDQILTQTAEERRRLRQQIQPHREALLAELIKDKPDDQVLERYTQSDWRKAKRRLMVEHMKEFMAVLTPDQRRAFANAVRSRWNRH